MYQGNLLMGIYNSSGGTPSVVQVCLKALDNSFSNIFSLSQLKSIKEFTKEFAHSKKIAKLQKKSCQIVKFNTKAAILNNFISLQSMCY